MPSVKESVADGSTEEPVEYRLYKRLWIGLIALVLLNLVSGMLLVWFGPIASDTANQFGFTLDEVNWLGNVINVVYLPSAFFLPYCYDRLGIRGTAYIGAALFITSAWIRYAGTAQSLSPQGSYALILIGQLLGGFSVPIFQIIVPSYSERWFDLKGRTTATMIMGLANPVGNALGQLIPPLVGTPRDSLLVMAIIFTAAAPAVFFVGNKPPTAPTFAATHRHPSIKELVNAMMGRVPRDRYTYMTVRQRFDFALIVIIFGVLVGIINAFGVLTGQQLEPYGYSSDTAGLMGAVLLLFGLIVAAITSPLFDRVLTNHLALSAKIALPIMAACWVSLIWEIKPNNDIALYIILAILGGTSLSLLPVVLELSVELTRNAEGSSAILWFATNVCGLVFVLVEGALRAGPDANPPLNMRRAVIFQASVVSATVVFIYAIEGKQTRRAQDEAKRDAAVEAVHHARDGERGTSVAVVEADDSSSAAAADSPGARGEDVEKGVVA